jgi:fructosamine-3-kinase
MKDIIYDILEIQLSKKVKVISEIIGLGQVNKVYDVKCHNENFIVRINTDSDKMYEFYKEKWCIEKALALNIPSPEVIQVGVNKELPYMVLGKLNGLNGSTCTYEQKVTIWKNLGSYAKKFHAIKKIDTLKVETDEFHSSWSNKLEYNIIELSKNKSLIERGVFSEKQNEFSIQVLKQLKNTAFNQGLIHGDLCPRNVIFEKDLIYLLDWGSSKIDIVPHTEIGIVQTDNKLSDEEFGSFLLGLGLSRIDYEKIEAEISQINFLNCLDVYRWAEGHNLLETNGYSEKLLSAFENIIH